MRELMKEFEEKKRVFDKGSRDVNMELPLVKPFDNLTIPDHILEGQITIPQYGARILTFIIIIIIILLLLLLNADP